VPVVVVDAQGEQQVRRVHLRSLYDCEQLCGRTSTDPGRMADRRACRCSLPGFDSSTWDPAACPEAAAEAEGLHESLIAHAANQGVALEHDLDTDGCPWGWVVSRFASSVAAYIEPRSSDSPVRSQNARLWRRTMRDETEPTRLLDWVRYAERIEDGTYSYFHEVASRR
jgi:hypothetical protein